VDYVCHSFVSFARLRHRVDVSTSMTSLPDLEVRCSVHTYGSLRSVAHTTFQSAVTLTVPYWRLARKHNNKEFWQQFHLYVHPGMSISVAEAINMTEVHDSAC